MIVILISCFCNKLFCLSVRYLQPFPLFILFGVKSFFYFVEQGSQIVRFLDKMFFNVFFIYIINNFQFLDHKIMTKLSGKMGVFVHVGSYNIIHQENSIYQN